MPGWFAMIAINVGLSLLAHTLRPRDRQKVERREPDLLHPATLAEFQIPLAAEGRPIPVIWGIVKSSDPTVLWYGDLYTYQSGPQIMHYYLGVHYGLCWGPVELISIEADDRELPVAVTPHDHHDEIAIDSPDIYGGYGNGGGLRGIMHLYRGTDEQPPEEYLATQLDRAVSGYPGLCHAVLVSGIGAEVPFYVGERPVLYPMAWVLKCTPNELGLMAGRHELAGDANPACMLYQILTDTRWGLENPPESIDRDSFILAGNTLASEGFGLSMRLTSQAEARSAIDDILRHIDGLLYSDPATGLLCLRLIRFDYDPAELPRFGPWNVLDLSSMRRPSIRQAANTVRLTYLSRSRFRARTILAQDLALVQAHGGAVVESVEFAGISRREVAQRVAARCLQVVSYPPAALTFRVNRSGFRLLPGSPLVLDWPQLGVQDLICRVTRIDHGNPADEDIEVQAVEDIDAVGLAGQGTVPDFGWTDPSHEILTVAWEIELPDLIYSTCEIADIDGDGDLEIVFLCWNNTVYVARPDGTIKHSRQFTGAGIPGYDNAYGYVCAVDVNGDGNKEIIFGSHDGRMRCLSHDLATVLWTVSNWFTRNAQPPPWPAETFFQNGPTPAIRDVSGTPTLCLFFTGFDGYLVCVRAATGEILWEHDTSVGDNSDIETAPSIKDIDGDGQPEIVIVALNTCQRFEHDGTLAWKYDHTKTPSSDYPTSTQTIADINEDGLDEIVFTGGHWTPENGREESLFVVDRDGVCLSRITLAVGGAADAQPVICDPTGDTGKRIYLADDNGKVYCLRWHEGALEIVWARSLSNLPINDTPCLLDVNGDGVKEVIIGTADSTVCILNGLTGTILQTIRLEGTTDIEGTITGGDIDGDGFVEVLVSARDINKLICYRGRATAEGNWFRRYGVTEQRTGEIPS